MALGNKVAKPCERKPLKTIEKDFFLSATTHGLGRIYGATNRFERGIWVIAFLAMFGSLIYNVFGIMKKINANEVVTVSRAATSMQMKFPAVTICNANPFRKSMINTYFSTNNSSASNPSQEIKPLVLAELLSMLNDSELYEVGHPFDEFVLTKPPSTFNNIPCRYPTDFQLLTTAIQGNCYTFNYNGTLKQQRPGYHFGLSLKMNINQKEDHLAFHATNAVGVLITIHKTGIRPAVMESSILAAPGHLTRIVLQHDRMKRLPDPYPDKCMTSNRKLMEDIEYNVGFCYLKCFADEQFKLCGVVDPLVASYLRSIFGEVDEIGKYSVANNSEDLNCTLYYDQKFDRGEISCHCPALCEEDIFRKTISSAQWPSRPYASTILKRLRKSSNKYDNWTVETALKNLLLVEIFFDDFSIYETKQIPAYDNSSFISDLGGQLGLWIGASIFSVLEVGAFIFQLFTYLFYHRRDKVDKAEVKSTTG